MQIDCYCNAMVSLSSKILIRFTVHVPKSESIIDPNMKTFYAIFKKFKPM